MLKTKTTKDLVSVVFPTMNRKEDLIKCIQSIKKNTHKKVEIVIADNGSIDGSTETIKKKFPEVILIENKNNLGSPVAINDCILKSKGEFVFRLDDDIVVTPDTIEKMLKVLKSDSKIGATSGLYFYTEEPNVLRTAGFHMNLWTGKTESPGRDKVYKDEFKGKLVKRDAVGGGSLLVRRSTFDEIGLFDESYFLTYEDVDWCVRLRKKGYKIIVVGDAKLYHKRLGGLALKENPKRVYLGTRGLVLFMKKQAGFRNIFFMPMFFLIYYPFKFVKFFINKQDKSIKAMTKGAFEAIFNEKKFVYTQDGEQVPYSSNREPVI